MKIKSEKTTAAEIEDFVETHLCKRCVRVCDTSIARATGFIWPHAGYTIPHMRETKYEAAGFKYGVCLYLGKSNIKKTEVARSVSRVRTPPSPPTSRCIYTTAVHKLRDDLRALRDFMALTCHTAS